MNPPTIQKACFALGFLSILGSIGIWFLTQGDTAETQAHAERFGIFVGLWAPTFFALAIYFRPLPGGSKA